MAEHFPFPRKGGAGGTGMGNCCELPKMPRSGSGSNGANGMRKVMGGSDVQSRGPKGGKMPTGGSTGGGHCPGLPRKHSS